MQTVRSPGRGENSIVDVKDRTGLTAFPVAKGGDSRMDRSLGQCPAWSCEAGHEGNQRFEEETHKNNRIKDENMKNERQRKEGTLTRSYRRFGGFVLGVGLLVCGCGKEPVESFAGGDPTSPILPGAGVTASVDTRSDLSGVVSGTAFPANTDNVFFVTGYSGTGAPTDWSSPYIAHVGVNSGSGSALSFATPQYYPANGDKVYFYAYSPAGIYEAGTASAAPTATWTLDGTRDIMWSKVDKGIAKNPDRASQEQPSFQFGHLLKQVTFKVKKDASFADGIKLTSLKIIGAKTSATLDLATGGLSCSGTGDLTAYEDASGQTITSTAAVAGSAVMFEPGSSFKVRAVAGGLTYADATVTLSGTNAGAAGISYEVTLTFKCQEITATASVASWTDGGTGANVDDVYPYVLNGNTIVLQDISGQADLDTYPIHEPWTITPDHTESVWNDNTSGMNVYGQAFEVAKGDVSTSSIWPTAADKCASYQQSSDDVGKWRLPTVRELKLIYDKRNELTSVSISSGYYYYWSSTGSGSVFAWRVYFATGGVTYYNTSQTCRIRCIRDL